MRIRRGILVVVVLVLGGLSLGAAPVAAETSNFQAVPATDWTQPGPGPFDGLGQWVYVAPIPTAGPGQLPTTGYVYGPTALPIGGGIVQVGLSTDDHGPVAGIGLIDHQPSTTPAPVVIRYAWSPGQFYFLFTYHLGGGVWGGWVYDYTAAAWTYIGSVQGPKDWGLLGPASATIVTGATGAPMEPFPFLQTGIPGVVGGCSVFPRVDAYFYPPLAFRDGNFTVATLSANGVGIGNCPTTATAESGWVHHQLGTPAASSGGNWSGRT